jgi:nucleotide-binding universal stress UspA family protein
MPYKKILSGVDGSDTAFESLRQAAQLAQTQGAELVVLCVFRPADQGTVQHWKEGAPTEVYWRITEHAVADEVLDKAKAIAAEYDVVARTRSEIGDAADTMVVVAQNEGIDLIVVGNRGMSGARRFVLGSVPNNISHHAPCDLLIVDTIGGIEGAAT